ncbi:MAG: carbohydrate-binding protein [Blautia sp.]|nr:carbohydrate-binding protein [Blautia sp.]
MHLKLEILDRTGKVISNVKDQNRIALVHQAKYHKGDKIVFSCDTPGFYQLRLDDTIPPALVFIERRMVFPIPFGRMERVCYSPYAFKGVMHLLSAEAAEPSQIAARRNLAFNPLDQKDVSGIWPHAVSNVQPKMGSLFIARNAIDGICASSRHFPYPYQSWSDTQNPDAELRIEFGQPVIIDELVLTLRADYALRSGHPHDSYWTQGIVEFSDGSREILHFEKGGHPQHFKIAPRTVTCMTLKELIKAEEEAQFCALRQIEAWGTIFDSLWKSC